MALDWRRAELYVTFWGGQTERGSGGEAESLGRSESDHGDLDTRAVAAANGRRGVTMLAVEVKGDGSLVNSHAARRGNEYENTPRLGIGLGLWS